MSVTKNVVSNFLGTGASALILICATPVYLRYLGTDAFGLVGVFTTLTGIAALLDVGLTPALTRELAKQSAITDANTEIRATVRTLEVVYCAIAAILLLTAFSLMPLLATHWLKPSTLGTTIVERCLQLMAIQLAIQLPLSFYTGGFIGMQKQGLMNILNTTAASIRAIGAVALLVFFQIDVVGFFTWQAVVTAGHLLIMGVCLWKVLP
jgi:O-antigen/teichoic acid export membrane protein